MPITWEDAPSTATPLNAANLNNVESRLGALATYITTGEIAVGAGLVRFPFPFVATLVSVTAGIATPPTGAALIVDVHRNGTTIFSTQANRPTIAAGANATAAAPTPNTTAMAVGDYLTVDIDQVGSTVPGSNLTVQIYYRR